MIELTVTNRTAVITGIDRKSKDVRDGASEGIRAAADKVAVHIAGATPVKTGRARDSVYAKMRNSLEAEVGYAQDVRWYMRIVEISGSRPHVILARGLRGSLSGVTRTQMTTALRLARTPTSEKGFRGEVKSFQRNVRSFTGTSRRTSRTGAQRLYESLKAVGVDAARLREFRSGLKIGARALAFESKGGLIIRSAVLHPGLKAHRTLHSQLAASQGEIVSTIQSAIHARLEKAAA